MKFTQKIMLALAIAGSCVLTSCKDYEDDDRNNILVANSAIVNGMQTQIDKLNEAIGKIKNNCECSSTIGQELAQVEADLQAAQQLLNAAINGNNNGLVVDQNGNPIPLKDAQGNPLVDAEGNPLYVASITKLNQDLYLLDALEKTLDLRSDSLRNFVLGITGGTDLENAFQKGSDLKAKIEVIQTKADSTHTFQTIIDSTNSVKQIIDTKYTFLIDSINKVAVNVAGNTQEIARIEKAYLKADTLLNERIDSVVAVLDEFKVYVDSVMNSLYDARVKLVTGIIVEQVKSKALGSYNSVLSNMQTNFLMASYGTAAKACAFPSFDPKVYLSAGETIVSDAEDNAGRLYLTINPVDEDFDKLNSNKGVLTLVNTQDVESSVKLGVVKASDAVLTSGYSRASNNGFYEVPAMLSPELAKNDSKLHLNIDKSLIKKAMSDLVHTRKASDAKILVSDFAKVALDVAQAMKLEQLGVKCAWEDSLGEHAVYSKHNITALAVKPLGFKAVDNVNFPYEKAMKAVNKIKKQIDDKVISRINKELAKYKEKIDQRGIINIKSGTEWGLDNCYVIKLSYEGNADVKTSIEELNQKLIDAGEPKLIVQADYENKYLWVRYSIEDFRAAGDFVDGIAINDIANMTAMLDELLERMSGKAEKVEGKVYDLVVKYLDKINNGANKAIHSVLHPVLLVNSAKGFNVAAVKGGVPTPVAGQVVIMPTTFNAEVASPIYKKYIKINDNPGEIVEGMSIDITNKLVSGINTITFSALDYTGAEETIVYQIQK